MANAYFKINYRDNKTYLALFPATDNGASLTSTDVKDYFTFNNIEPDSTDYITELANLSEPKEILISNTAGFPINEYFSLKLSDDKMAAIAKFFPPSTGGQLLNTSEIVNDLQHKGIKVPIDEKLIQSFLNSREYNTPVILVRGIAPIQGYNASIEYFFNTDLNTKPTLNEDGSVDFFNLNTICKCTKGQVLATLTPEKRGTKGMRVTGEAVLPRDVISLRLKHGNNISISEDGLSLISNVNGHVSLVDDKVFVSDVYEVVDVDTSTGNIDYDGSVLVKGNVKTGFKIKAAGNVEVKGVVEGAQIKAGGNVIIARGFNGMSRGVIEAEGNVVARFIENGTVVCGGNLHSEAIMHSKISASGDIEVTGKKGFIVGGSVKALGNVTCKAIGSEMGGDTFVDVGVDPKIKQRAQILAEDVKRRKENLEKLIPVLATLTKRLKSGDKLSPDQLRYLKQLSEQYKVEKEELEKANMEYDAVMTEIDAMPQDATITVTGKVFPGAVFTINEVSQRITTMCARTKFIREGADIRIKPL